MAAENGSFKEKSWNGIITVYYVLRQPHCGLQVQPCAGGQEDAQVHAPLTAGGGVLSVY